MISIWSKKKACFENPSKGSQDEGLRILTNLPKYGKSNIVIIKVKPIFSFNQIIKSSSDDHHSNYCYLKSCHLCQKLLSLDKEIYMYRGDLGFCSLECRDRQIYLDETTEMEISTQKILASFRRRHRDGGGRCETTGLLEDFPQRRHPFSSQKSRVIFS